jgi:microsomal dipeptidase-like Zn-dependent dipeptidase
MDTIANLNDFRSSLARRGYSPKALDGIFCGNFLGFLKKAWS